MNKTTTSIDKIKLLDQMLEDMAGDEYDDENGDEADVETNLKRYDKQDILTNIDSTH